MLKPTKNPQIEELTKSYKERRINLGDLTIEGRKCVWCLGPLKGRQQKWCSSECTDSAFAWANPQKEAGLQLLLSRQNWKCALCQYDYRPALESALRSINRYHRTIDPTTVDTKFSFHLMRFFKWSVPKAHRPEVDHIQPIYKGGQPLGFDNHQAICYPCHKGKTKVDNSGPRKKNEK